MNRQQSLSITIVIIRVRVSDKLFGPSKIQSCNRDNSRLIAFLIICKHNAINVTRGYLSYG